MKRLAVALVFASLMTSPSLAQEPAAATEQPTAKAAATSARPNIYDENADAKAQIAAALKKAKRDRSRVLIQWGGNWCGWCHLLHTTFQKDAAVKQMLRDEYILVLVDAGGRGRKNLDLAASYGAELQRYGYPFLTILDADGKPVANQETESLELKDEFGKSIQGAGAGHDPAKVLAFLDKHKAPRVEAQTVLDEGIAAAKASNKKVFVHFGAPWCGWCHRLEDWMAREDIEPLLSREFVDVKIDQDRMPGAREIQSRLGMPPNSGIPWFAVLDPNSGRVLATSTGPQGNIGFPYADEEVAHFMTVLQKVSTNLSANDLSTIRDSLTQPRKQERNR